MKIYKLDNSKEIGYCMYDSIIVAANDEVEAKLIYPDSVGPMGNINEWCLPEEIILTYIGEASEVIKAGLILASYTGS